MTKCVTLISGGLDSSTLLYWIAEKWGTSNIKALSVSYGQKHTREIDCAKYHTNYLNIDHTILDLSTVGEILRSALINVDLSIPRIQEVLGDPQPPTYVPFRNLILLSIAAGYAESHDAEIVYYAAQKHDLYGYWDTTDTFVSKVNDVFDLNRRHSISVQTPFLDCSKTDILKVALDLEVDLSHTWSCYSGRDVPCLTCPTCAERTQAFMNVGLPDPVVPIEIWNTL